MTRKELRIAMVEKSVKSIDIVRFINKEGMLKCTPGEFSAALSGDLKTEKAEKILEKAKSYIKEK